MVNKDGIGDVIYLHVCIFVCICVSMYECIYKNGLMSTSTGRARRLTWNMNSTIFCNSLKVLLFTYLVYYIHLFIHSFNKHILILCARLSLIFLFLCRCLGKRIGEGSGSKTSLTHGPGEWDIVINARYLFSVDSDIKVRKKPIPAPQEKFVKKTKSCHYKPNKII